MDKERTPHCAYFGEITALDFVIGVNRMRNAQKKYFNTRSSSALEYSKRCEKEVDRMIELITADSKQAAMF